MKKLILILFVLVLAGTSSFAEDKKKLLSPETWSITVKTAVADILSTMPDEDKEIVRKTKKEELVQFHHGRRTGIRNCYGLWRENNISLSRMPAAEAVIQTISLVIIKAIWTALQSPTS